MWIYCDICGAVAALIDLHADWHAARGETPPDPEPAPEEVITDGDQPA